MLEENFYAELLSAKMSARKRKDYKEMIVETPFNENSPEVRNAVRTSQLHGYKMWTSDTLHNPIEITIKNVFITKGEKYAPNFWKWPMYEIETDKGVFISAYGPDKADNDDDRKMMMRKNQNNGIFQLGVLAGGGAEVYWDNPLYKTRKLKVITGPSDRNASWTWIYFIHESVG